MVLLGLEKNSFEFGIAASAINNGDQWSSNNVNNRPCFLSLRLCGCQMRLDSAQLSLTTFTISSINFWLMGGMPWAMKTILTFSSTLSPPKEGSAAYLGSSSGFFSIIFLINF